MCRIQFRGSFLLPAADGRRRAGKNQVFSFFAAFKANA
jgi:hypothetical protein